VDWLNTAAGFVVGLLVGFTGVGGGALMTPLLVLAFGVAPQTAVGTDLLYAALTKTAGSGYTVCAALSTGSCCAACGSAACRWLR